DSRTWTERARRPFAVDSSAIVFRQVASTRIQPGRADCPDRFAAVTFSRPAHTPERCPGAFTRYAVANRSQSEPAASEPARRVPGEGWGQNIGTRCSSGGR